MRLAELSPDPLSRAVRDPASLRGISLAQWDRVIRFGRAANLLARLAHLLQERGMLAEVPEGPRAHLEGAAVVALAQTRDVRREVAAIERALAGTAREIVLLKGAAYLMAGLEAGRGRLFSDIDILVPRLSLGHVEAALMLDGWATTHLNAYDQRYYRRWMHELPPMRHIKRFTALDVHHAILPTTARSHPDSAKLLAASRPVAGSTTLRVLGPADMVLHSAAHLFHNEELDQGLRDLADLDALLAEFSSEPGFWMQLVKRAEELELTRPLTYALQYVNHFFGARVPAEIVSASRGGRPRGAMDRFMDRLFLRALRPDADDVPGRGGLVARKALYVRAHWLRMPPWLLAYHLTVKMFRREEPSDLAPALRAQR